jgi:hypothetical protein
MAIKKNRNVDQAYAHNLHLGLLREIKEGRAVPSPDISPEARKKYEKIKKILKMIERQEAKFLRDKAKALNKITPTRKFRR